MFSSKRIELNNSKPLLDQQSDLMKCPDHKHGSTLSIPSTAQSRQGVCTRFQPYTRESYYAKNKLAKGLEVIQIHRCMIKYRNWNDPNKLSDRLRLLISSKRAGNTGP